MTAIVDALTQPPLWFDSIGRIQDGFSIAAKGRGFGALVDDGASEERALAAMEVITREAASYIAFGPFKAVPDQQVKAEIAAIAKAADRLNQAIDRASASTSARLRFSLAPSGRGLFGRIRNAGNPDPVYSSAGAELGGLAGQAGYFNREIAIPADMSAKFERVRWDLHQLVPLIRQAGVFPSRRGRPENWRVRSLFETVIAEWADATDQPPTASQIDGAVVSPLLTLLRDLIYPATDYPEVSEALSDAVYLSVLARMKQRRGALQLMPGIPSQRRRKRKFASNSGQS